MRPWWGLAAVALAGGCGPDLATLDSRTEALMAERTAMINAEVSPRRQYEDPELIDRPGQEDIAPPTVNPPAEELPGQPADPGRDISRRLQRFALQAADPDNALVLDMPTAFRVAQRSSREFLNAEEDYLLAAIRLLIERHLWGPRFFNDVSATVSGSGDDGEISSAISLINDLRVTRRLPYGGEVEARWLWEATEQLRSTATGRYQQASELVFNSRLPLLRGAGLAARESLIQAERNLIYEARRFERFRREFLVQIARDYFSLVDTLSAIANQKQQIRSLRDELERTQAMFEAGRRRQFDVFNTRNDLLAAESTLANLRDRYIAELDRFKIRLGIPVEQPVVITRTAIELSEPDITLEEATRRALEYRLDLQNLRDQLDDARRAVAVARNDVLPDLELTGEIAIPTDPDAREGGLAFDPDDLRYSAGVSLSLPLDRQIERLRIREAVVNYEQRRRQLDQVEDETVLDTRSALRAIELARFDLQLAEERVRITELRREEQQIRIAEIKTQDVLDTQNQLLRAYNDRDQAQTRLRTAVLDYLLTTGQLRVNRDGQIEPLPGLDIRPVELFIETEGLEAWYLDPPSEPEAPDGSEVDQPPDDD